MPPQSTLSLPSKVLKFVSTRPISQLSIIGILLGAALGLVAALFKPTATLTGLMKFPGILFINCLKTIVLLFIIVIMTRTPMDMVELSEAKTFATFVISYYFITTLFSSLVGLLLVNIIRPGKNISGCTTVSLSGGQLDSIQKKTLLESIKGVFTQALPDNIFLAVTNNNVLGILVVFLCLGFYMARYAGTENGKTMKRILDLLYQTNLDILDLIICMTPIGVFSLISGELANITDNCVFAKMGMYIVTFLAANVFQVVVVFPLMYLLIVRKNPFVYMKHFSAAAITAFSTASSAAALPLNIQLAYDLGIDKNVVNFVLPLGSTLNMNGSSIYYPVTIMFISFMYNFRVHFTTQILICIITTLVTVGSAPVPSGALVYLTVVSDSVSITLPQEAVSLIWAIDPIMDRVLTTTNVIGDSFAVEIVDVFCKRFLLTAKDPPDAGSSKGKMSGGDGIVRKSHSGSKVCRELSNSALSTAEHLMSRSVRKMTKSARKKESINV